MKEDTKEVISKLIDAMKLQNDAMKQMVQQIKDLQKTVEELKKSTKTEVHNHYHNNYTYPRYPYYTPVWSGSGTTSGEFTINGRGSTTTSYGTNASNSIKE